MDLQLKDKKVFISGSTSGIGYATAKSFLQEGAIVIINGRKKEKVEAAVAALKEEVPNSQVSGVAADFSQPKEIQALIQQLPDIDILINNVGLIAAKSFYESTDEDWYEQFEVNVMSGVRLARHFLPKMIAANWGRIIFISSECATLVPADLIPYSMTKTALLGISRGLAQLCRGTAVTVNAILPGSTFSEGAQRFLGEVAEQENKTIAEVSAEFFNQVRTSSLLERFIKVEEVAQTITYMASPRAAASNGTSIKIDGGSMGGII